MKRIEKFGSLSVNQKLSVLKDKLGEDEILLFQYYEIGDNSNVSQEDIDETFEYYCDDIIYYYNSDVKLPDITHGGVDDNYYEANTLRIAEILGYQNAQWRPFDTLFDFSYIENAKQKIIFDLKEIIKKNNYDK